MLPLRMPSRSLLSWRVSPRPPADHSPYLPTLTIHPPPLPRDDPPLPYRLPLLTDSLSSTSPLSSPQIPLLSPTDPPISPRHTLPYRSPFPLHIPLSLTDPSPLPYNPPISPTYPLSLLQTTAGGRACTPPPPAEAKYDAMLWLPPAPSQSGALQKSCTTDRQQWSTSLSSSPSPPRRSPRLPRLNHSSLAAPSSARARIPHRRGCERRRPAAR